MDNLLNQYEIRASFTETTIKVYQAYPISISSAAVKAGRFVPPFKIERMTWIKPSFLWMMYRSGWASKPGQERILEIEITREGFNWALANSVLSSYFPGLYDNHSEWQRLLKDSSVRIQWDPERDLLLNRLPYRSIQIGLSGVAVRLASVVAPLATTMVVSLFSEV